MILPLVGMDRVELRPTGAVPDPSFPKEIEGPAGRLFVNGRPTQVVVPAGYDVDVRCRNANGRVGGAILWATLSDVSASLIVEGKGFVTEEADHVRLIPFFADAMDGHGRVLGIVGSEFLGDDTPYRAELWAGHRIVDLGPAAKVRFDGSGRIEGYCETDGKGKPVNLVHARAYLDEGQERYVRFTWWDGFRDDGSLLRKPPF